MKTKSLKKLKLNKATIVELNKQDIEALKGQGTCFCGDPGPSEAQNILVFDDGECFFFL